MNLSKVLILAFLTFGITACESSKKSDQELAEIQRLKQPNKSLILQEGMFALDDVACDGDTNSPVFPTIPDRYQSDLVVTADGAIITAKFQNLDGTSCTGVFTFNEMVDDEIIENRVNFTLNNATCFGSCINTVFQFACNAETPKEISYDVSLEGNSLLLSDPESAKGKAICDNDNGPTEWYFTKFANPDPEETN